jgi:hypothetical protein
VTRISVPFEGGMLVVPHDSLVIVVLQICEMSARVRTDRREAGGVLPSLAVPNLAGPDPTGWGRRASPVDQVCFGERNYRLIDTLR